MSQVAEGRRTTAVRRSHHRDRSADECENRGTQFDDFYLWVPHGYDERVIAQCALRLLVEDVGRASGPRSRSTLPRVIEGNQTYDGQQEFLADAARVGKEGRLSRFVYVSKKLSRISRL